MKFYAIGDKDDLPIAWRAGKQGSDSILLLFDSRDAAQDTINLFKSGHNLVIRHPAKKFLGPIVGVDVPDLKLKPLPKPTEREEP